MRKTLAFGLTMSLTFAAVAGNGEVGSVGGRLESTSDILEYGNCMYKVSQGNELIGLSTLDEVKSVQYNTKTGEIKMNLTLPEDGGTSNENSSLLRSMANGFSYRLTLNGKPSQNIKSQDGTIIYEMQLEKASSHLKKDYTDLSINAAIGVSNVQTDSLRLTREVLNSNQIITASTEALNKYTTLSSYGRKVFPDMVWKYNNQNINADDGGRQFQAGAIVYTCDRLK